jgi:S1-C subfamily serine protease
LKQYGRLRRQEIGVGIQTITPEMAAGLSLKQDYGGVVSDVLPGGPAEAAGLMVGDVLVSIDREPADNIPSVNYHFLLRDSSDPVEVEVLRASGHQVFKVKPVEDDQGLDRLSTMVDPAKSLVPELGVVGLELDNKTAALVHGLRDPYGIIVVARAQNAPGDVPLLPGDVIRSFNTQPMTTLERLRGAAKAAKPGSTVVLQIQRDAKLLYIPVTLQ